jgi:hypothetical protein
VPEHHPGARQRGGGRRLDVVLAALGGGCKSWVDLDRDIPVIGATPVLDQTAFDQKINLFLAAVNPATV